jgi:hypothetical protein
MDYWTLLLESNSSKVHCESNVSVADAWGQFGNLDEMGCLPFEPLPEE